MKETPHHCPRVVFRLPFRKTWWTIHFYRLSDYSESPVCSWVPNVKVLRTGKLRFMGQHLLRLTLTWRDGVVAFIPRWNRPEQIGWLLSAPKGIDPSEIVLLPEPDEPQVEVQINGRHVGTVSFKPDSTDQDIKACALLTAAECLLGREVTKTVLIRGELVNIITVDGR